MHFSSIHAAKKKGFVALIEALDKQETPVPVVQTIRAVFLLAFIYVVTGKLALLLALPPGYASAFFPPAGIAVAAVMTRGPRLLPGVLLGSLALNVMLGFDQRTGLPFAALLAAAAAAVASTLQAWYGSKLLQRWLQPGLDSSRDVLLFPLLAAFMCLLGASIAVPVLFLLGIVSEGDLFGNWATWWMGDTIGVLLAAPLTWILIGKPRPLWWGRRWLLSLPLIVSSSVFIVLYVKVSVWEHEQQTQTFQLKSQQVGDNQKTLEMGGRDYQLTVAPTEAYLAGRRGWQSWIALASALLLTGLLGAFLLLLTGQRAQIREVVIDRTRKLREREARLNAILDTAADAILTVDRDGVVVSVNGATGPLFGYRAGLMPGLSFDKLVQVEPDDNAINLLETLSKQIQPNNKLFGRNTDGRLFPMSTAVSLVEVTDETFFVCILHDLTDQLRVQEQIYQLVIFDALTGLPNRFTLNIRLEQLLTMARRNQAAIALMFIDLDNFKKINDSHGQQAADQLLLEAANRLKQLLRDTDTVARLGGDEFVVILTNYDAVDDVADAAQRIIGAISEPYQLADQNLHTGASVGISMFPGDGNDVDTLLRNAETAWQAAKEQGGGNYRFYSPELNAAAHERLLMENLIWLGLEREEFELYLQPQIDLASGRIIGAEALIRWHQPELGMIMPLRFISIAEESGLIIPLGEWVLARSMQILAGWQQGEFPTLRLALNLSAKQCLCGTLLASVDRLQAECGVDLSWLEMEITETAAMQDPEQTQELLQQLRSRGIMVAIDDFGTGYSSLNYLKLFAIDRIKIDRSFVKDIETDQNDALIASATIALAHALGLQVIAEGAETEMQRLFLSEQHCDEAQGYLFGRPMPLADFEQLVRECDAAGKALASDDQTSLVD